MGECRLIVPQKYFEFIESDRLSEPTRTRVEARMAGPGAIGAVLDEQQMKTLRAMLARIVPGTEVDVAGFVMARLSTGKGDGWRYDVLPTDLVAYREGLDRLAAQGFAEMTGEAQDTVLAGLASPADWPRARWFEEVRGDAVAAYVAHPATLARLGYSGLGVGGAHTTHKGFVQLGVNDREAWEPLPERNEEQA